MVKEKLDFILEAIEQKKYNGEGLNSGVYLEESEIEKKVIEFLKKNPNPDDRKVHAFSEKEGINTHELEAVFYGLATKYVQSLNKKA